MIITYFFHNILNTDSCLFYYFHEKVRERGGREERGGGRVGEGEGEREERCIEEIDSKIL